MALKLHYMAEFVHWRSTVIQVYRGSLCGTYLDGVVINRFQDFCITRLYSLSAHLYGQH